MNRRIKKIRKTEEKRQGGRIQGWDEQCKKEKKEVRNKLKRWRKEGV